MSISAAVVKFTYRHSTDRSDLLQLLELSRNDLENGTELVWNVASVTRRYMERVSVAHTYR